MIAGQYPTPWHPLQKWEQDVISLAADALGNEIYKQQIPFAQARIFDEEQQIQFQVSDNAPIDQKNVNRSAYFLIEGIYEDNDGIPASLLLHGGKGRLRFLEIFKACEDLPIITRCDPFSIRWLCLLRG